MIVDKSIVVDNNCRKALLHNLLIIYAYDILKLSFIKKNGETTVLNGTLIDKVKLKRNPKEA